MRVIVIIVVLLLGYGVFVCTAMRSRPETGAVVSVMTCNTGDLSGHGRPVNADIIKAVSAGAVPEVLLLQEVYGREQAGALAKALGMSHVAFSFYRGKTNGVAVLSRAPLENVDTLYFPDSRTGYAAIAADVRVGKRRVTVVSLHLDNVYWDMKKNHKIFRGGKVAVKLDAVVSFLKTEFLSESTRSRSVRALAAWLEKRGNGAVIVGGDFNTIQFSRAVRFMDKCFDDALWPSAAYLAGTYHRLSFPVQPRIDYLFYGGGVRCLGAKIGAESPGDHFPVSARFIF